MSNVNSGISRRGFISASLTGLVSAGMVSLSPQTLLAQDKKEESSSGEIIYRTLGRTGMKVPIISLGVGAVNSPAIIQAAYEMGMRHFDTAANYANGRNEQMLGNVLAKLKVRDHANIGTKIFVPGQRNGADAKTLMKKAEQLLDGSLRRLKTDYVDILYVHAVQSVEEVQQPGLLEAMKNLKDKGKVKAIGLSTHTNMAIVINEAIRSGEWDVVLTSINFTLADDTELISAIDRAAAAGIGIVGMKTQAGGGSWPNPESRQNYSASTINKAALRWVGNYKNVHTSIPGMGNFDHLNEDWSIATNLNYTDEEKKLLNDNNIKLSMGFCRQCQQCLASCPHDTDIPTLMRTHMYAQQYGDFYKARETLTAIPSSRNLTVCSDCTLCSAKCAQRSVDIAANIDNLKQIYS